VIAGIVFHRQPFSVSSVHRLPAFPISRFSAPTFWFQLSGSGISAFQPFGFSVFQLSPLHAFFPS
jgi:hypothetical protein